MALQCWLAHGVQLSQQVPSQRGGRLQPRERRCSLGPSPRLAPAGVGAAAALAPPLAPPARPRACLGAAAARPRRPPPHPRVAALLLRRRDARHAPHPALPSSRNHGRASPDTPATRPRQARDTRPRHAHACRRRRRRRAGAAHRAAVAAPLAAAPRPRARRARLGGGGGQRLRQRGSCPRHVHDASAGFVQKVGAVEAELSRAPRVAAGAAFVPPPGRGSALRERLARAVSHPPASAPSPSHRRPARRHPRQRLPARHRRARRRRRHRHRALALRRHQRVRASRKSDRLTRLRFGLDRRSWRTRRTQRRCCGPPRLAAAAPPVGAAAGRGGRRRGKRRREGRAEQQRLPLGCTWGAPLGCRSSLRSSACAWLASPPSRS